MKDPNEEHPLMERDEDVDLSQVQQQQTRSIEDPSVKAASSSAQTSQSESLEKQEEEGPGAWDKVKSVVGTIFAPTHMKVVGLVVATGFLIAASVASAGTVPLALAVAGFVATIGFTGHAIYRDVQKHRRKDKLDDLRKIEEERGEKLQGHGKDLEQKLANKKNKVEGYTEEHLQEEKKQLKAKAHQSLKGQEKDEGALLHRSEYHPVKSTLKAIRDYLIKPLIEIPVAIGRLDIPEAVVSGVLGVVEFVDAIKHRKEYTEQKNAKKEAINEKRVEHQTILDHREERLQTGRASGDVAKEKVERKVTKLEKLDHDERVRKTEKYKEKYGVDVDALEGVAGKKEFQKNVASHIDEQRAQHEAEKQEYKGKLQEVYGTNKTVWESIKSFASDAVKILKEGTPITASTAHGGEVKQHPSSPPAEKTHPDKHAKGDMAPVSDTHHIDMHDAHDRHVVEEAMHVAEGAGKSIGKLENEKVTAVHHPEGAKGTHLQHLKEEGTHGGNHGR